MMALIGQKTRGENFLATSRAIFTFKGGRGNAEIAEDDALTRAIEATSSVMNFCIIKLLLFPFIKRNLHLKFTSTFEKFPVGEKFLEDNQTVETL